MEKIKTLLICLSIAIPFPEYAWNLLETTDEARQRHSAERYEIYRNNGYRAPLGGYPERFGDPAPYGTERPGYTSPKGYGNGSPYGNSNQRQNRW